MSAVPDGASLLDDVHHYLGRFVSYPSADARIAHALWIAHAWFMAQWDVTPRIAFLSPEPGSGKSRALEVTAPLVPRPVHSVNASPAYVFRKISDPDGLPTILFDEVDTIFGAKAGGNEDLRGLLNAGYRRGAVAGRATVSKGGPVGTEELPVYAAVALAGLDDLPDTIMTRAVVVRMQHRTASEVIEPWRNRHSKTIGAPIAARLAEWSALNAGFIDLDEVALPEGIADRAADIWEPLIAVADLAGADWPDYARSAAIEIVTAGSRRSPTKGIRLLRDLRTVFREDVFLASQEAINRLLSLPDSEWLEMGHGRSLSKQGLSRELARYQVRPAHDRVGGEPVRGYRRSDLEDAWLRYLPGDTR